MNKIKFRKEEVLSFVEEKIAYETATQEELEWYENMQWNRKLVKDDTYIALLKEMKKLWNQKF